jgi:hypothetical protein
VEKRTIIISCLQMISKFFLISLSRISIFNMIIYLDDFGITSLEELLDESLLSNDELAEHIGLSEQQIYLFRNPPPAPEDPKPKDLQPVSKPNQGFMVNPMMSSPRGADGGDKQVDAKVDGEVLSKNMNDVPNTSSAKSESVVKAPEITSAPSSKIMTAMNAQINLSPYKPDSTKVPAEVTSAPSSSKITTVTNPQVTISKPDYPTTSSSRTDAKVSSSKSVPNVVRSQEAVFGSVERPVPPPLKKESSSMNFDALSSKKHKHKKKKKKKEAKERNPVKVFFFFLNAYDTSSACMPSSLPMSQFVK